MNEDKESHTNVTEEVEDEIVQDLSVGNTESENVPLSHADTTIHSTEASTCVQDTEGNLSIQNVEALDAETSMMIQDMLTPDTSIQDANSSITDSSSERSRRFALLFFSFLFYS